MDVLRRTEYRVQRLHPFIITFCSVAHEAKKTQNIYILAGFLMLPCFWAHIMCPKSFFTALLDFPNVLDRMNQIMLVKLVILQGLWCSEKITHHFIACYFCNDCDWEKCLLGQCTLHDGPRNCLATIWNWLHSPILFLEAWATPFEEL